MAHGSPMQPVKLDFTVTPTDSKAMYLLDITLLLALFKHTNGQLAYIWLWRSICLLPRPLSPGLYLASGVVS